MGSHENIVLGDHRTRLYRATSSSYDSRDGGVEEMLDEEAILSSPDLAESPAAGSDPVGYSNVVESCCALALNPGLLRHPSSQGMR